MPKLGRRLTSPTIAAAAPCPAVGPARRLLRLDSSRVGQEASFFGAMDTTLARFTHELTPETLAQLDTLRALLGAAHAAAATPADSAAVALARVARRTTDVRLTLRCGDVSGVPACAGASGDLAVALNIMRERANRGLVAAAGLVIDGSAARELVAAGDSVPVTVTVYNGADANIVIRRLAALGECPVHVRARHERRHSSGQRGAMVGELARARAVLPLVANQRHARWNHAARLPMMRPNAVVGRTVVARIGVRHDRVEATVAIGGVDVPLISQPIMSSRRSRVRGDTHHALSGVPGISVLLERTAE